MNHSLLASSVPKIQGEKIRIRGVVQGVGFRPAVWRFAKNCGLTGEVLNDGEGVLVRAWGSAGELNRFVTLIENESPALARIDTIERQTVHEIGTFEDFKIAESRLESIQTGVVPDLATCPSCLKESLSPSARRYRYPFTNCSNCGPRFSIVKDLPYDRARTSMSVFKMCDPCQKEYTNPNDRRYHAQPIACPSCGPRVKLERSDGRSIDLTLSKLDVIDAARNLLKEGNILAIKGIGGFQLVCDATRKEVVEELRKRKQRYEKPFALMARDIEIIKIYCHVSEQEKSLLESPEAPIVILKQKKKSNLPAAVAPGMGALGFMLPGTPLHFLLVEHFEFPMVCTSGNLSEEPQCVDNEEARERLKDVADYFLLHDREIVNRVDDSVSRFLGGKPQLIRRGRGYSPDTFPLPPGFENAPALMAVGGELKNTFCLIKNGQAFLSQHIGDLKNPLAFDDFKKNISLYTKLFQHEPQVISVDCHPDYLSTKFGKDWAESGNKSLVEVQHHHAHVASCMGENRIPLGSKPVLGVALDGLGYGEEGSLWGGEFLLADYKNFNRLGCLKPIPLLGGSQAMREPWRNTLAYIFFTLGWDEFITNFSELDLAKFLNRKPVQTFQSMIEKNIQCPSSSSAGRLFDAVAAAIGVCREQVSFEGQAAMELEAFAGEHCDSLHPDPAYSFEIIEPSQKEELFFLDSRPMWRALFEDLKKSVPGTVISRRFHMGLANAITGMIRKILSAHNNIEFDKVALTGGVFQNVILLERVIENLQAENLAVLTHSRIPANDGGLSLGQALVGASHWLNRN